MKTTALAILLAVAAAPAGAQDTTWAALKTWEGEGPRETETFEVAAPEWRIRWQAIGGSAPRSGVFQIYLKESRSGEVRQVAANSVGPGSALTYVHAPGRYFLSINAANIGWRVSVEVPRPSSAAATPVPAAREAAPPPQVMIVQEHNPAAAGLFSLIIPGAGQAYNGQWGKGAFFLGADVALLWLDYQTAEQEDADFDACVDRPGLNECELNPNPVFGLAFLGTYVWGIVDAARSAKRLNADARAKLEPRVEADGRVGLSLTLPAR